MRRTSCVVVALVFTGCLGAAHVEIPAELSLPAAILWSHPFPRLLVEFDFVEGQEPSPEAMEILAQTLRDVTSKESIEFDGPSKLPSSDERFSGSRDWTLRELADVHNEYFEAYAPGYGADGVARLHVMYLNGRLPLNSTFLVAFESEAAGYSMDDAIFLFPDDLPGAETADRPWRIYFERHTLIHEVGHTMGLVDNGIPMVRPHVSSDGIHSDNDRSVMFGGPGYRGQFFQEALQDNEWIPYKFDADDLADLEAFRDAAPSGTPEG